MANRDDSTLDARNPQPEAHVVRLLDGFLNRQAAGEALSEEALLAAHPECADELREHLELVRHLRPRQHRIEELLARRILQPSADRTSPALLDEYHVHGVLGEGGMGVVLDGYDPQLNRRVALKVLRPELAQDALVLARFEREAKTAGALQHPNVVTVHSVGCTRGTHYIVMEHVDGPSLAQVLGARGPLPMAPARAIFRQILDGLAAAHEAGLIHRDIKSSNILLDGWPTGVATGVSPAELGEPIGEAAGVSPAEVGLPAQDSARSTQHLVKIADFGLARMRSSQTQLTLGDSILGTPEYMSPEQARGDTEIDHRTDLYSAGVVLYEILTGRTPFKADTPTATIRRVLDEVPPNPVEIADGIDPCLSSVALRLICKSPEDRFASATRVLTALAANQPVPVRSDQPRVAHKPLSRLLWLAMPMATALAVGWFAWRDAPTERVVRDVYVADDPLSDRRYVRVLYEGAGGFELFPADIRHPTVAVPVDHDGSGKPIVVVGLGHSTNGFNLIAFDAAGNRLPEWQMYLHDPSGRRWPGCNHLTEWTCVNLVAGDLLDGDGAEEVVAVASDVNLYPTRISVIDPRTLRIRSTFWHLGNIEGISICSNGIDSSRPAIIAWGSNNALDGFRETPPDDKPSGAEQFPTPYDFVPVAMVLDPMDMDGLSPPMNTRPELRDLPPANLYAYAFLDLPGSVLATYFDKDESRYVNPEPDEAYKIQTVERVPASLADGMKPWLQVTIEPTNRPDLSAMSVGITVDQRLGWCFITPTQGAPSARTEDYWSARWRRITPVNQGGSP